LLKLKKTFRTLINNFLQNQLAKPILALLAMIIVSASFWYTNRLVRKIEKEERREVALWAGAIERRAALVKLTNELFLKLQKEERKKSELWALGIKKISDIDRPPQDIDFIFEVIQNNETVPVILTNDKDSIITFLNLDNPTHANDELLFMKDLYTPIKINISKDERNFVYYKDSKLLTDLKSVMSDIIASFLSESIINATSSPVIITDSSFQQVIRFGQIDSTLIANNSAKLIKQMKLENKPIEINLGGGVTHYVLYQSSTLLKQLRYYPLIQISAIALFVFFAYYLFSITRKSEQNRVWVGMSKETAHQLGTPISSLMAWSQILESELEDQSMIVEINKDIDRLKNIADRFSKVGSAPELEPCDLISLLSDTIDYLSSRIPRAVNITTDFTLIEAKANMSPLLFSWVMENLIKNAVDAMSGRGNIHISLSEMPKEFAIKIKDTGAGIPKGKFKSVFKPGYTSKRRGWGLGLTLARRIIAGYHKGRIFVSWSEKDLGTEFTMLLPKKEV